MVVTFHFQLLMKTIFQYRKMAGKKSPTTDEDNFCVGWASFPTDPDQQECKRVRMILVIYLAFFPLQRAHSLASSLSHDN